MNGTANNTVGSGGSPTRTTTMVDETSATNGSPANNNHASSSSLMESEDMEGRDNPAFETDDPGGSPGKKQNGKKNGDVKSGGGQSVANNGRNGGDVEMVPLNPNVAAPQQTTNGNGTTTTTTTNSKDQKVALDTMYSDYFRPVNTRRKLLRCATLLFRMTNFALLRSLQGEKLYVTRDQRAHSRGWKWIAFWGGVFTFVAAALLTGILAATGIIMSKSEPTFGSSHSTLVGNGNHSSENDTDVYDHDFHHISNQDDVITTTEHTTTTTSTESPDIPVQVDFGNSLDDNTWTTTTTTTTTTTDGHHEQHQTTTDHVIYWLNHVNITGNDLGVETTATTTTTTTERSLGVDEVAVSDPQPSENFNNVVTPVDNITNSINDRGRSLDEAVTVLPMDDETTLFPTLKSIDEFEDETDLDEDDISSTNSTATAPLNETETTTSLFDNDLESSFWNTTNVTNGVTHLENEEHHEASTERNLLLDQSNSSVTQSNSSFVENKDHLANETVQETSNGTSIDGRNAVSSVENGTELVDLDDVTKVENTTSYKVQFNQTTPLVLPSTDATTITTTTVSVHDKTWTQMSNLSLTPSDMEDLFNETTIPLNVSINTTTSDANFNETITFRNANVTTDVPEEDLLNNSTVSSSNATKEMASNTTMGVTNETVVTTAPTTIVNSETTTHTTTIVNSEVTTHNTTRDELLNAETTQSAADTTEELSTSQAVEMTSSNATSTNSTTTMVTENSTTSLFEEESVDANLAEV